VLALNIAILALLLLGRMGAPEAIILTLIIGGLLDRFIIRWAWRKANAGLEPVQKHAPETKTDAKAQQTPQAIEINAKEAARRRVRGRAVGLLIVGLVGGLTFAARQLCMTWMVNRTFLATSPIWLLVQFLDLAGGLDLFKGLFLIAAALPMLWLRAYWLAVAASIVAMLPVGPSFLAGLPIGIWTLVALSRTDVKAAFAAGRQQVEANAGLEPEQNQTDKTDADVKTEQTNTNSKINIGKISLILAIGGAVVSIAVALLLALIESLTNFMPPYTLCFVLFVALEIAALVTGIIGWRSACGKAGLIISAILLLLSSIVLPASRVSSGPSEVGPFGDKVKR